MAINYQFIFDLHFNKHFVGETVRDSTSPQNNRIKWTIIHFLTTLEHLGVE